VIIDEETSIFRKSPLLEAEERPQSPTSSSLPRKEDEFTNSAGSDFVQVGEDVLAAADPLKIVSWGVHLSLPINPVACFVVAGGEYSGEFPATANDNHRTPIVHLAQLLGSRFLDDRDGVLQSVRVSVQSLSLSCLAHMAALYPHVLVCGSIPVTKGGSICLAASGSEGNAMEGR